LPQQIDFFVDFLSKSIPTVWKRSKSSLHCISLQSNIENQFQFNRHLDTYRVNSINASFVFVPSFALVSINKAEYSYSKKKISYSNTN